MLRYEPSLKDFTLQAQGATVVPVSTELLADTLTPVLACAKVADGIGGYLLESVVGGEKWSRYSFVGFEPEVILRGAADRLETITAAGLKAQSGVNPWQVLQAELDAWHPPAMPTPQLPRFWGGAVGYVGYDAVRSFEPHVGAPSRVGDEWEFCFAIGGTVLIFDNWRQTLRVVVPTRTGVSGESLEASYRRATARIDATLQKLQQPKMLRSLTLTPEAPTHTEPQDSLPASSFDQASYCAAVRRAQEHIRAGDIFQVVLSQRFSVPTTGVDCFDLYRALRVINPSPYMYFLRFPEVSVAGASPETLVRLESGVAEVRPIAGTRPRGRDAAEDGRIELELLADPKERAEHVMLVDLGRNDLGRIAIPGTVRLTESMAIERYSHVMHIVSNVSAKLAPGRGALDVLRATFPAGTLSGAPKVRAMQIIDELEPVRRGLYGGAVGYIGFDGNLDMAIAIRTLVQRGNEISLQAGAGVVEASDPQSEYQETVNKARAGLLSLTMARQL